MGLTLMETIVPRSTSGWNTAGTRVEHGGTRLPFKRLGGGLSSTTNLSELVFLQQFGRDSRSEEPSADGDRGPEDEHSA